MHWGSSPHATLQCVHQVRNRAANPLRCGDPTSLSGAALTDVHAHSIIRSVLHRRRRGVQFPNRCLWLFAAATPFGIGVRHHH